MSSFQLTNKAKADLKNIANFTKTKWGTDQRNIYLKQFDETFHLLAKNPLTGKDCNYIKSKYRKFPHGSHIIFYKPHKDDSILVVRILHKHMDVAAHF